MSELWEPWVPEEGQTVRVKLSGECPVHTQCDYEPKPVAIDGRVGYVVADIRTPGRLEQTAADTVVNYLIGHGHWWFVRFDEPVGLVDGVLINADEFCAAELEPVE